MVTAISSRALVSAVRSRISGYLQELVDNGELNRKAGSTAQGQLDAIMYDVGLLCDLYDDSAGGKTSAIARMLDSLDDNVPGRFSDTETDDVIDTLVERIDGDVPLGTCLDSDDAVERVSGLLKLAEAWEQSNTRALDGLPELDELLDPDF